MAGGKETPRQKMIGMMYLVLTALLALNVSKSILDAFVSIEENIQKSNIVQVDRGNGFRDDVKSELATTKDADQATKRKKLEYVLARMTAIDKETEKIIKEIDDIKLNILSKSGEDVSNYKNKDEETILWIKAAGVKPARMNLMAVQAQDQYDVPMYEIVGDEITNPTGSGKKLWDDFNNYRSKIVELTGSYIWGENGKYSIHPTKINQYEDNADLQKKVTKMVDQSKGNLKDDRQVLIDIYTLLTKKEKNKVHDQEGIHWIGMTFDHSPLVAAVASLSSMQQDILSARAMALNHWKSKVSTGDFSFNSIVGLAYGPSFANNGEEVNVNVMMAAFDSDNNPTVEYGGNTIVGEDGKATVKAIANGSEIKMKGTVSIKSKSGLKKTKNWEHIVKIVKPSGAISIPEFNVLYRGYENVISAVASGFDQTILTAGGATLTRSGQNWIAHPSGGSKATLTVAGKNSMTGKTQTLLTQEFKVMTLPTPLIYAGGSAPGERIGANTKQLFPKYGPGIPLQASFTVVSWTCSIVGAAIPPIRGNSADISTTIPTLRQAKSGMKVLYECQIKGKDGIIRNVSAVFII